jgi:RNAse Z (EC 3.1.26.11)
MYHETTFLADREDLAEKTKHSTTLQAAEIASKANVVKLVVGHFSGRYKSVEPFKLEVQTIFKNVVLAQPGKVFTVN